MRNPLFKLFIFNMFQSHLFRIFFCFVIIFFISVLPFCFFVTGSDLFVPTPPKGPSTCDINIISCFIVNTTEVGSSWMFDWGEGNFSEWIFVGSNDNHISQNYSWKSYGVYNVSVKHRSEYLVESSWSKPLIVIVEPPSDIDGDGFDNELEASYGTNQSDANDHPIDTDGDGLQDDNSKDLVFIGDLDDDNDGVEDTIEKIIGSNPKIANDFLFISIKGSSYILANIDFDQYFEVLYNVITEDIYNIQTIKGKSYLDINGDKIYDYIYHQGSLNVYEEPFEISWIFIVILVICIVLLFFFILFKKGILFFYHEEMNKDE